MSNDKELKVIQCKIKTKDQNNLTVFIYTSTKDGLFIFLFYYLPFQKLDTWDWEQLSLRTASSKIRGSRGTYGWRREGWRPRPLLSLVTSSLGDQDCRDRTCLLRWFSFRYPVGERFPKTLNFISLFWKRVEDPFH